MKKALIFLLLFTLPVMADFRDSPDSSNGFVDGKENAGSVAGDVVGPAVAVDGNITLFSGVTGKIIKDSGVAVTDLIDQLQHVVEVSPAGGDHTSIKAAVDYVTTQLPTNVNRWVILVGPGVYTEAPMVIKAYVDIVPVGERFTTKIVASDINNPLFSTSGAGPIGVRGLSVSGVTNNAAFLNATASVALQIEDCHISYCKYGVQNTAGATFVHRVGTVSGSTMTNMFYLTGGQLEVRNASVQGTAAFTEYAKATGGALGFTEVFLNGPNITTALDVDSTIVTGTNSYIDQATTAILADNGSVVKVGNFILGTSNTTDVSIGNANVTFYATGCQFHSDKFVFPAGYDEEIIQFIDSKEGDRGLKVFGEFAVGRPGQGSESVFGEGDSYTRGMLVYEYDDGAATYTLASTEATSASGSTFAIPGVDVDDAVYVASSLPDTVDYLQFYGLKMLLATAPVVGGGGIDTEYWNGSAWVHFDRMLSDSGGSYYPHAESLAQVPGSYQMRFNNEMLSTWAKNDLPGYGTPLYWIRIRNTGGITTAPVWEQFKLHTSRMEINDDGTPEYFGPGRPIGQLSWNVGLLHDIGATMGTDDLWMGEDLGTSFVDCVFNTDGDYAGFTAALPLDIDTSIPIQFDFSTMAYVTGNVRWTVRWGYSTEGDSIVEANPGAPVAKQWSTTLATLSKTANQQAWWTASLDISPMVAERSGGYGDTLWVTIERHVDTVSNQALIAVNGNYTKWREGGHR